MLMCCCRATDIFAKPEGPHRLHAGQLDVTADGGNSKHHRGGRSYCPAAVTTGMPAADRAGRRCVMQVGAVSAAQAGQPAILW